MIFDKLLRRGLISGIYPESSESRKKLIDLLSKPCTIYTGFDATGSSLHVGHLATIVNSLYFYSHGHQVIWVVGDATAQVGDPSGQTKDRERINPSVISENAATIELTLKRLLGNFRHNFLLKSKIENIEQSFEVPTNIELKDPIIVRNSEWYTGRQVIEFVDEIFRDVRVGGLLHKKSIQERLNSNVGMNMAEFSYQIFQGFDWLELRKRYSCTLQIGGNDQQGNIYTGHDMIKKRLGLVDSIGLLAPLIVDSKGKKLGKTTSAGPRQAGIWLEAKSTSPYDLYQFFHRTTDNEVEKYLRIFSFYSDNHIDNLIQHNLKNKSDVWYCQRKLAEHACLLVHGKEGLDDAERITKSLFPKS